MELSSNLAGLNLTGNRLRFAWATIDHQQLALRNTWAKRVAKIEERLSGIKASLRELESDNDDFKDIVKEVLGEEVWIEMIREAKRRREGKPPMKVMVGLDSVKPLKEKNDRLRNRNQELTKMLIAARKALNEVIRERCHKHGNADFLRLVSPANTALPTILELEKRLRESIL